jgi:transposase, IS5 family
MLAFYTTPLGDFINPFHLKHKADRFQNPKAGLSGRGYKAWFDVKGGIALQVLKSYYRISDALLIEQLNGNWQMQFFCGIQLRHGEQIKDQDIVSRWRSYLARHIDIDKMQQSCAEQWKRYMQRVRTGFTDATVFESHIEYPTDAKLLWKSCTNPHCS